MTEKTVQNNPPIYGIHLLKIALYRKLSASEFKNLKEVQLFKIHKTTSGVLNFIIIEYPCKDFFEKLNSIIDPNYYHICYLEVFCDDSFATEESARRSLWEFRKTYIRKYVFDYRQHDQYNTDPKKWSKDPDAIGPMTLCFGLRRYQLAVYIRKQNGHFILRNEIKIVNHGVIKRLTGIDTILDLLYFDSKIFFCDWFDSHMKEAKINYEKIRFFLFGMKSSTSKIETDLQDVLIIQLLGETPSDMRNNLKSRLAEYQKSISTKRGPKTTWQKAVMKIRLPDLIK